MFFISVSDSCALVITLEKTTTHAESKEKAMIFRVLIAVSPATYRKTPRSLPLDPLLADRAAPARIFVPQILAEMLR
jgi:hypothetical protein